MANKYNALMDSLEKEKRLPKGLLNALIQTESSWDNNAVSPVGAKGLAQFMPSTARQYGVDVNDPESSIRGSAQFLGDLSKKYKGDLPKTLAGYNWGQGNVDRKGLENAPPETRNYMDKILSLVNPISGAEASEKPWQPPPGKLNYADWKAAKAANALPSPPPGKLNYADWKAAKAANTLPSPTAIETPHPPPATEDDESFGHKAGVFARGALEGVAGIPQNLYGMTRAVNKASEYLTGISNPLENILPETLPTEQYGTDAADYYGLPKANEKDNIIYPVSKAVGGFVLPAGAGAGLGSKVATWMGGKAPLLSTAGIIGGKTASEQVRKSGGNEWQQIAADAVGNIASGNLIGVAKAVGRTTGRATNSALGSGIEGVAGRTLHRAAGEESATVQNMLESGKVPENIIPKRIKNYNPTTSEVAGNAGISTIMRQTGLSADEATAVASRKFGNLKAIDEYAERAAGKPGMKDLREEKGWKAVEEISKPMRERNASVDLSPVRQTIDDAIAKHKGNKAITKQLEKVKKDLPEGDTAPFNEIYNFKQGLDEALRANVILNPQLASLQRAKSALEATKKSIADTMTETEPGFSAFIAMQAKNIKKIEQTTLAEKILDKSRLKSPVVSNASGIQEELFPLSSNSLTNLVRNEKEFNKLSPRQQKVFNTAQKHSVLSGRSNMGMMSGSPTAQNLSVEAALSNDLRTAMFGEKENRLTRAVSAVGGLVTKPLNPFLSKFEAVNKAALSKILTKAELDPTYAAKLMKEHGLGHLNFNDKAGRAALRAAITSNTIAPR